jgi:hypothetical protein
MLAADWLSDAAWLKADVPQHEAVSPPLLRRLLAPGIAKRTILTGSKYQCSAKSLNPFSGERRSWCRPSGRLRSSRYEMAGLELALRLYSFTAYTSTSLFDKMEKSLPADSYPQTVDEEDTTGLISEQQCNRHSHRHCWRYRIASPGSILWILLLSCTISALAGVCLGRRYPSSDGAIRHVSKYSRSSMSYARRVLNPVQVLSWTTWISTSIQCNSTGPSLMKTYIDKTLLQKLMRRGRTWDSRVSHDANGTDLRFNIAK